MCGQSVTVCAEVSVDPPGSGTPTGSVTFTGPGGLNQTVALDASGQACLTSTALASGTVTATYSGDGCAAGSVGTASVTVNLASTTTAVSVVPDPSVCGQSVTVCAQVTTNAPGSGTPTGTVTFTGPGGLNQTVPLNASGQACLTTTALASGTITATYNGASCFSSSTGTASATVDPASTTTAVSVTPNPSVCGQSVTVCAQVTTNAPGSGTPTGTVTFTGPGGLNQTVPLNAGGQACLTTTTLASGTITATYNGAGCFNSSTGSASVTVNEAATTTAVSVTPNPSVCGQSVTVCAQVTTNAPGSGTPTGTVTFTGPGGLNQTVPLNASGQACLTSTALASGTVTATYNGEGPCFAGSSGTASVTVNPASTTTAVSVTPNPSVCGQSVTVCAQVTTSAPGSGTPTGTVTFTGPGGLNQTVPLNASGQACFSSTALASGTITATYNGASCFAGSSGTVSISSTAVNTTITVAATQVRLRTNGTWVILAMSATLKNAVTNAGIPGQPVVFTANTAVGPMTLGTAVTNASGVATLAPPMVTVSPLVTTANTYTASFAGASCLNPSSGTAPLTTQRFPLVP
ncbi:beta strand repeat-containing protein [Streptomyces sp. NBC_01795]|uniref:beta strand repeat-containing protein n=1 Tax=Streptomyces sp. NBC_01795 TaxID=2975943 RepID=UPI003FA3D73A